ncbi:hypothetical protein D3P08_07030 [Paenibacillus nanensis]|uniref:ATP-dependent DNA ligase family profile domain-containing protein n=1 Tax=Paenibacillus nanensis TaxID=393251 RepID=A0A3A1UZH6_9BACL|nr:hypothetical protein [Paenibacillus nanensis]RIX53999.1 hypothetical protein D3P08_07030 [Paenibacillus nanensis]
MFIQPMLMTERPDPFNDNDYLFEPLIDGHRLQLTMTAGKVRLLSRHGYDVTRQYPELHNVPLRRPADVVLDGEVAFLDPLTGQADFDRLQQRYRMTKTPRIRDAKTAMPVVYFIFDILHYNGLDVRDKPLYTRKRLLKALLEDNAHFKQMGYVEGSGIAFYNAAKQFGLEGIAGKRKESRYSEGRSEGWVKIPAK